MITREALSIIVIDIKSPHDENPKI